MDGTLTVPTHDFNQVRVELDIPPGNPIIEYLEGLSDEDAKWRNERLLEIEWEHARIATADDAAYGILEKLTKRGARVGVVTRNALDIAFETLKVAGIGEFFDEPSVIARDCAPAKPEPDGVQLLLHRWNRSPQGSIMIGDYVHDLEAGRAAGADTVHLDHGGDRPFMDYADYVIDRLEDLHAVIDTPKTEI